MVEIIITIAGTIVGYGLAGLGAYYFLKWKRMI